MSADDAIMSARMTKSDAEIEIIRSAVATGEMGMRAGIDACVEGSMEFEASAAADHAMRSFGAEAVPFSKHRDQRRERGDHAGDLDRQDHAQR